MSWNSPIASHCCVKGYESGFVSQCCTLTFACREWPKLPCWKDLRHANSRTPSAICKKEIEEFIGDEDVKAVALPNVGALIVTCPEFRAEELKTQIVKACREVESVTEDFPIGLVPIELIP